MAVYQQYGTGTKTETKKKKSDDDGVDVGTKNTNSNTNSNRSGSVVALMSTLVAVVLMVIVLYVQASASFSSTAAFEDANLLRSGTGTNTVIIDDSAVAGVVAAPPLPPKIGALLSSFILSDKCVDRFHTYQQDVQWKSACMCLVGDMNTPCFDEFNVCKNDIDCQHQAAERFSSCDKDEEEFDDAEFGLCAYLNYFPSNPRLQSTNNLVNCFLHHKNYLVCFRAYPPSSSYP